MQQRSLSESLWTSNDAPAPHYNAAGALFPAAPCRFPSSEIVTASSAQLLTSILAPAAPAVIRAFGDALDGFRGSAIGFDAECAKCGATYAALRYDGETLEESDWHTPSRRLLVV